jgi:hypothetical protein
MMCHARDRTGWKRRYDAYINCSLGNTNWQRFPKEQIFDQAESVCSIYKSGLWINVVQKSAVILVGEASRLALNRAIVNIKTVGCSPPESRWHALTICPYGEVKRVPFFSCRFPSLTSATANLDLRLAFHLRWPVLYSWRRSQISRPRTRSREMLRARSILPQNIPSKRNEYPIPKK